MKEKSRLFDNLLTMGALSGVPRAVRAWPVCGCAADGYTFGRAMPVLTHRWLSVTAVKAAAKGKRAAIRGKVIQVR